MYRLSTDILFNIPILDDARMIYQWLPGMQSYVFDVEISEISLNEYDLFMYHVRHFDMQYTAQFLISRVGRISSY